MSKAIVTFGTGKHADMLAVALPSFEQYAKRHQYKLYVADEIGTARPPSWYKVIMLQQALAEHEVALWIDADVVIVDGTDDWEVPADKWQAMVKHATGDGDIPNHGIWYAKRELLPWLDKIWAQEQYRYHGWWEQAAAMHLMGYQPDIRPVQPPVNPTELYQRTHFMEAGWNVHTWDKNKTDRPRFKHATMMADPLGIMKEWAVEVEQWVNHF